MSLAYNENRTRIHPGDRYGRWTVLDYDHKDDRGSVYWLCECDCGNISVIRGSALRSGRSASCGCYRSDRMSERNSKHGMYGTPLYHSWQNMKSRCTNPNDIGYHRYGGRGIIICNEWLDFESFKIWAMDNGYMPGLTVDRIDNDGCYCPENCRWADIITQANNRSTNRLITYNGNTHTIAEWARLFDIDYYKLHARVSKNDYSDFENYYGNTSEGADD